MRKVFLLTATLLFSFQVFASSLSSSEVERLKKECKAGTGYSCTKLGKHYKSEDASKAKKYFKDGCAKGCGAGCSHAKKM